MTPVLPSALTPLQRRTLLHGINRLMRLDPESPLTAPLRRAHARVSVITPDCDWNTNGVPCRYPARYVPEQDGYACASHERLQRPRRVRP